MKIVLSERARTEYLDGFRFLLDESPGAAIRFESRIEEAYDLIRDNPEIGSPVGGGSARSFSLRSFRYRIFYSVEDDAVNVISLFHTARDPRDFPV